MQSEEARAAPWDDFYPRHGRISDTVVVNVIVSILVSKCEVNVIVSTLGESESMTYPNHELPFRAAGEAITNGPDATIGAETVGCAITSKLVSKSLPHLRQQ